MDETEKLLQRTLAGEAGAWTALQAAIEPAIMRIARRHPSLRRKGLAELPDDLAEIRTSALERLAGGNFCNLRSFVQRSAGAHDPRTEGFDGWLYGIVDFAVREHLRRRFGRAPKLVAALAPRAQPSKRDLQSCAGRFDELPERGLLDALSLTARMTVGEILAYIASAFEPAEARALSMYYAESLTFEEIAAALGLEDAKAAEQLLRRLNARLRYRFASSA